VVEAITDVNYASLGSRRVKQVHNNLGVALEHLEQYPDAITFLRRAVRLAPAAGGAWTNLETGIELGARGPGAKRAARAE
jgi:Flp pilus assembly protein TadD